MWTAKNRGRYDRGKLRYPSDLTGAEWEPVEPLVPPGKRGGGKRTVAIREVVNGLMYVLSTGCQWRAIPKDLPPKSTLYDYFDLWSYDGTLADIHRALYGKRREQAPREASPAAAIIDSQSVKSAEKGGPASIRPATMRARRSRAKRHALVDTLGLLLHASVHPAAIRDRDGGMLVMATLFGMFPFLQKLFAGGGYRGPEFEQALARVRPHLKAEIVKRSARAKGFVAVPKRWLVDGSASSP